MGIKDPFAYEYRTPKARGMPYHKIECMCPLEFPPNTLTSFAGFNTCGSGVCSGVYGGVYGTVSHDFAGHPSSKVVSGDADLDDVGVSEGSRVRGSAKRNSFEPRFGA